MLEFTLLHPRAQDMLGIIPEFLSESDPRPAREQIHEAYAHGGGWHDFKGFSMNPNTYAIKYPGDPAYQPAAIGNLRDEIIVVYPHAWVAIIQADGTYSIARID